MKTVNILRNFENIGQMVFDDETKTIKILFDEENYKKYIGVIKLIVERINMRSDFGLIFDSEGIVRNANEDVLIAIQQELFLGV